jgi:hypothetical protein
MIGVEISRVEWQCRAGVAELADARDLKSRDPKGRPGSIPGPGTNEVHTQRPEYPPGLMVSYRNEALRPLLRCLGYNTQPVAAGGNPFFRVIGEGGVDELRQLPLMVPSSSNCPLNVQPLKSGALTEIVGYIPVTGALRKATAPSDTSGSTT